MRLPANRPSTIGRPAAVPERDSTLSEDQPKSGYEKAVERGFIGTVPDEAPNSDYALGGAISEGDKPDPALPQSPTDNPQPPQFPERDPETGQMDPNAGNTGWLDSQPNQANGGDGS